MLLVPCILVYNVNETVYTRVSLISCIHVCYRYPRIHVFSVVGTMYKSVWSGVIVRTVCMQAWPSKGYVISLYTKYCPEKQSTFTRDHIILEAMFTEVQGNFSVARDKCNEDPKHNVSSLSGYTSAKNTYNDRSVSLRCTGTAQSV